MWNTVGCGDGVGVFEACCAPRCGVRSYVFALMHNGHVVTFCGHHGTLYWDNLERQAVEIDDRRGEILPEPVTTED